MNHKEFFNVLIGNPPPEVELEIEITCREVKELPDFVIKNYCCDLVKSRQVTRYAADVCTYKDF